MLKNLFTLFLQLKSFFIVGPVWLKITIGLNDTSLLLAWMYFIQIDHKIRN